MGKEKKFTARIYGRVHRDLGLAEIGWMSQD